MSTHLLLRAAAVAALVSCFAHSARGGTEAVPEVPVTTESIELRTTEIPQPETGTAPAIPLSRDAAILTAILRNRSLAVARLAPEIEATGIAEARAVFDPTLGAALTHAEDNRPILSNSSSTLSSLSSSGGGGTTDATLADSLRALQQVITTLRAAGDEVNTSRGTDGTITLQQRLPLGTQLSVSASGAKDNAGGTTTHAGAWLVELRQPLLKGAGIGVNLGDLRQAEMRVEQSAHDFTEQVITTVRNVEQAYWDLVLSLEIIRIREFGKTLADDQLARVTDLVDAGRGIEADIQSSRAELAAREADLADAVASAHTQYTELIELLDLGDAWDTTFLPTDAPEPQHVPLDPMASAALALDKRPALAASRIEIDSSVIERKQARNNRLPSVDLVGSYGRSSAGFDSGGISRYWDDASYENYRVGIELQTSILHRAERARVRRASLQLESAERSLAQREQAVQAEVRRAIIEAERQWKRIAATREALEGRAEELSTAEDRYSAGKITNLDVKLVQRDFLQAQVDDITARARYLSAIASVYAAEGTLLERRGVRIPEAG